MNLPFPTSTPAPSSPVQPVHVHPIVFPACAITSLIICRLNSQICMLVVSTASRTAGRVEGRNPKSVPALRCHVRSQCRAPDEAPLHCGSPSSLWKKMKRKRQYTRKRDRCLNVIALLPGFYWTSHSAAASATRLGFSPPPLP